MNYLDWIIVIGFCIVILIIGLLFSKKGSHDTENYFIAGRKLPWWLAGMSMLATNFGSDTPIVFSSVPRRSGILGCWFFFRQIMTQITIGIFFGKLWRRSRAVTDVQFYEMRHSGNGASILRGCLGGFYALLYTPLRIAIFILGMQKLCTNLLGLPEFWTLPLMGDVSSSAVVALSVTILALIYAATSGIVGVVWTDLIEFIVAMVGTYALMFYAIEEVGGLAMLREGVGNYFGAKGVDFNPIAFLPGRENLFSFTMLFYLFGFWWLTENIGGKGAAAQRLMACRSEKDANLSVIWNVVVSFAIRSWPWIITGFASLIIFPSLVDHEQAYPMMIVKLLPHGLIGLIFVSFLSAFLSSIDSNFNLGASYLVNDLYRRYLVTGKSDKHYLGISKISTVLVAAIGVGIALFSQSMLGALMLAAKLGAGYGPIKILRWFWWRINAWTELATVIGGLFWTLLFGALKTMGTTTPAIWVIDTFNLSAGVFSERALYFSVEFSLVALLTLIGAITTMYLTPPVETEKLKSFYRLIKPAGPGWRPIAKLCPEVEIKDRLGQDFLGFGIGLVFSFSVIFAAGSLFLGLWISCLGLAALSVVSGFFLFKFNISGLNGTSDLEREEAA